MIQAMRLSFALLALLLSAAASAADLGRLFFTPQQRQDLDHRRAANIQETVAATPQSFITVNGQVVRSSGKSTTWINGVPEADRYRSRDPARIEVAPVEGEAKVPLKVGQTWEQGGDAVTDGLAGGEIKIHRPTSGRR